MQDLRQQKVARYPRRFGNLSFLALSLIRTPYRKNCVFELVEPFRCRNLRGPAEETAGFASRAFSDPRPLAD